jgi:hypothetical protein
MDTHAAAGRRSVAGLRGTVNVAGVSVGWSDGDIAERNTSRYMQATKGGNTMRAETQNLVEEIKQSVRLLRRHL